MSEEERKVFVFKLVALQLKLKRDGCPLATAFVKDVATELQRLWALEDEAKKGKA